MRPLDWKARKYMFRQHAKSTIYDTKVRGINFVEQKRKKRLESHFPRAIHFEMAVSTPSTAYSCIDSRSSRSGSFNTMKSYSFVLLWPLMSSVWKMYGSSSSPSFTPLMVIVAFLSLPVTMNLVLTRPRFGFGKRAASHSIGSVLVNAYEMRKSEP